MDKKTIIVVVALGLLVIFWFPVLEKLGLYTPAPPVSKPATEQLAPAETNSSERISAPATPTDTTAALDSGFLTVDSIPKITPETLVVITEKYRVTLTTHGGGPVGLQLREHSYRDGKPIEMLVDAKGATPDFAFAGGTFAAAQLHYASSLPSDTYTVTEPLELTYTHMNATGGKLTKTYRFFPDRYDFDVNISIENLQQFGFARQYFFEWGTPLQSTEPSVKTDYEAMEVVAMMGKSRVKLDDFRDSVLNESRTGTTEWVGVREMYFAAVLIPKGVKVEGVVGKGIRRDVRVDGNEVEQRRLTASLDVPFVSLNSLSDTFTVFVGPMDYFLMSSYDIGLEDMLDIGTTPVVGWIIKPFALAIMWLLPNLYKLIPNYGVVIILFAFLVKMVTLPLSLKAMRSMNALKDLSPKMEELRKRHKNNPQELNAAMMKLYKEQGVNPFSGCLPILLQMPLFFAMFSVFRATILLRDAPFVWFVDDLSRGATGFTDPYIILVVLMIAAQFISQYLTMSNASPQNKVFMYIFPVMMGFLFYSFASGLVVYWTAFSLFSMLDYFLARRGTKNPQIKTA